MMRTRLLGIAWLFLFGAAFCRHAQSAAPEGDGPGCGPHCEAFGPADAAKLVVFLHGSRGTDGYREMAQRVAAQGYRVFFPHLYEVRSSHGVSDSDYAAWTAFVEGLVDREAAEHPERPVILFGVSLGASVALAAAVEDPHVAAVVDWAGSLPDTWFMKRKRFPPTLILHGQNDNNVPVMNAQQLIQLCTMMKQTCTSHLYPGEGHVFPGSQADAWRRTFSFMAGVTASSASSAQ